MYQMDNSQTEDEIVIDIDGQINKIKRFVHKRGLLLLLVVLVVCGLFVLVQRMLYQSKYQGYVTYMVNYTGDEGTDAFVASMLGNHIGTIYIHGGLRDLIVRSLNQKGSSADWLTKDSIGTSYDSTTNLLTVYCYADTFERMEVLQETLVDIFPTYAVGRFNDITLVSIDENLEPEPINQYSNLVIIAVGFLVGLFVVCLMIVCSLFMNQMIYSKEDMKKITHISFLGEIPRVEKRYSGKKDGKSEFLSIRKINKHNQRFAESIRSIRFKLVKQMDKENDKVLLVISSVSGEGKTTISANMAYAMAESGKRVVLLDGDLYRASISECIRGKECKGTLAEYLKGKKTMEEIITQEAAMDVIYGDANSNINSIGLYGEKMNALLAYLRENYDYIVVDTAPTLIRSDAEVMSTMADAFVYVVNCDNTEKKTVQKGLASLVNKELHCLGYILNGVDNYSGSYTGKYYKYYRQYK